MTSPTPAHAAPHSASATRRHWLTLVVVGLAQLVVVLDATVVNIALPSAQADLGFSDSDRQWVVTAYSLAFGSLLLLGGRLSDLMGRKLAFILGLIGFAAASALGGAAPDFTTLIVARALQGVFGALLAPTALAVLTTTFTVPKERARAFGVFGAIAGAGGALGLLLGGILTQTLDWRWNLYINIPIAIVAIAGAVWLVPHVDRSGPRPKLDIPGTILVSAGLFGVVYGFSRADTDGWDSPWAWGSLIAAAVLLAAFALWQLRAAHPLLPLPIVLDRNRGASYLSILIAGAGMFGVFLFLTYYLQGALGFTPIQTGLAFLPMIFMLVLAAQLSTNLLFPRFGAKIMVPLGMVLGTVGMLLLTRLDANTGYWADVLPSLLLMGLAMGSIMPASMQTATLGVDRHFAGVASAMVNTSQQVGGSIGTALLNTIAATATTAYLTAHVPPSPEVIRDGTIAGFSAAFLWSAVFFAVGAVTAAALFRTKADTAARAAARAGAEPAAAVEPVPVH